MKMLKKKMNRNLDGCYFRVERDGKWQDICFSDLTKEEQKLMLKDKNEEWLKSLCFYLADVIKDIGDKLDIVKE